MDYFETLFKTAKNDDHLKKVAYDVKRIVSAASGDLECKVSLFVKDPNRTLVNLLDGEFVDLGKYTTFEGGVNFFAEQDDRWIELTAMVSFNQFYYGYEIDSFIEERLIDDRYPNSELFERFKQDALQAIKAVLRSKFSVRSSIKEIKELIPNRTKKTLAKTKDQKLNEIS